MPLRYAANSKVRRRSIQLGLLWASLAWLHACTEPPPPRTFIDFLDDPIGREGVLLRCNRDREATANDPECADARRAAAAVAAREDEARRKELEQQSERKREALRAAVAAEQQRELDAQRAAEAAAQAAYEAQWVDANPASVPDQSVATVSPPGEQASMPTGGVPDAADAPATTAPYQRDPAVERDAALEPITPPVPPAPPDAAISPVAQQGEIPRPFREPESDPGQ